MSQRPAEGLAMNNRDKYDTEVKLCSAVPTFVVADVGYTARWYREQLGFDASFFPETEPFAWASMRREGVEIMLLRIDGYEKPDLSVRRPEGMWDAYIRMEGIEAFYQSLADRDLIGIPLKKQPYGDSEFEVIDPNGYILVFSELIAQSR